MRRCTGAGSATRSRRPGATRIPDGTRIPAPQLAQGNAKPVRNRHQRIATPHGIHPRSCRGLRRRRNRHHQGLDAGDAVPRSQSGSPRPALTPLRGTPPPPRPACLPQPPRGSATNSAAPPGINATRWSNSVAVPAGRCRSKDASGGVSMRSRLGFKRLDLIHRRAHQV